MTPDDRPDIVILKDGFKKKQTSKNRFRLHKLSRDKYVTKKVRVVSLALDMRTGPYLCLYYYYQNISNHL